jgi:hypothetical protein
MMCRRSSRRNGKDIVGYKEERRSRKSIGMERARDTKARTKLEYVVL